ncbi:uncharacterized protein LOC127751302 [Frankliniella occidentalis]|uniref:Uncharacterized protein LOC127751302 n=1 Tax=Frankliniella occidentalis TaxID=133901 RepID=A0A9C6X7H9_FRAOC|nr:uncharacterized protein LOC127751302 [Frankliniella occidentalis]
MIGSEISLWHQHYAAADACELGRPHRVVLSTLCLAMHPVEMAAVAGVLLVSAVLNAVLAVAYESVDTVPDYASFGPLWSAYVLSSDGTPRIDLSAWRRDFNPLLDLDPVRARWRNYSKTCYFENPHQRYLV